MAQTKSSVEAEMDDIKIDATTQNDDKMQSNSDPAKDVEHTTEVKNEDNDNNDNNENNGDNDNDDNNENNNDNDNDNDFNDDDFGDDGNDDDDFGDDNDEWGDDGGDDWGDEIKLQDANDIQLALRPLNEKELYEKNNKNSEFWQCGKCDFKNNVWCGTCIACHTPNTDIIAAILGQNENNKNNKNKNKNDSKKKDNKKKNKKKNRKNNNNNNSLALKTSDDSNIEYCDMLPKCNKCHSYIIEDLRDWHNELCAPIPTEIEWNDKWYVPLTVVQKEAINKILKESMEKSDKEYELLQSKIETLGFTQEELDIMLKFMEWHVPITVRVPKDVITKYLIKDPYLRNLFETGTGKGGNDQVSRRNWETRMFGESYNRGTAFERPKYGCLNVSMSKQGSTAANGYGECYFVMKDMTCRWRTTLTNCDSCMGDSAIGILSHCCHVLNKFLNDDLADLVRVSNKITEQGKEHQYFREVQIHGVVKCDVDIEELWIPKQFKHDKSILQFINDNNIKLKIIDE